MFLMTGWLERLHLTGSMEYGASRDLEMNNENEEIQLLPA